MVKLRTFGSAAVICGGILVLSGCHSQATVSNGVPIPPPHAAPPIQTQIQEIDSNSHIPAAQKEAIKAAIVQKSQMQAQPTPSTSH